MSEPLLCAMLPPGKGGLMVMGDPSQEASIEGTVLGPAPGCGQSGDGDFFFGFNLKTQRPKEMYLIIFLIFEKLI